MAEKIALVTAGGHISSFHAAMLAMHERLEEKAPGRFELVGAREGIAGVREGEFIPIRVEDIDPNVAGSMIGADRGIADGDSILESVKNRGIYALVMMGGDNHQKEAEKWYMAGVRAVGYPKTIDGDLSSFITLGWESAVRVGALRTREHHASAITYGRVFYVPIFGRNTDWNVCAVAMYGGADVGIPCERVYDWEYVWDKISSKLKENKENFGKEFAVVPVAEGAAIRGLNPVPGEHQSFDKHGLPKLHPEWLGLELVRLTKKMGKAAAQQVHTYDMRDSPPTETEKRVSAMAGRECMDMILGNDFGKSVVFEPDGNGFYKTSRRPMREVKVQRAVSGTGFFDYDNLRPTGGFERAYGDLFRDSLGEPPMKRDLVYRNMRKS